MGLAEFAETKVTTKASCKVAKHPKLEEIDAGLVAGIRLTDITDWTHTDEGAPSMSYATVRRHKEGLCSCES